MSEIPVIVIVKNNHSVCVLDARTGNYIGEHRITSGEIVGSPQQSGNTVTITCRESGMTWVKVYTLPQMGYVRHHTV